MSVSLTSKSYMDVMTRALAEEMDEIDAICTLFWRTTLFTLGESAAVFGVIFAFAGLLLIPAQAPNGRASNPSSSGVALAPLRSSACNPH